MQKSQKWPFFDILAKRTHLRTLVTESENKKHTSRHFNRDTMSTSNYLGKHVCYKVHEIMVMCCTISACQEQMSRSIPASPLYSCHGIFKYRFIFRSNFPGMRLPWECHDQLQETNWLHYCTGPELSFFHERKETNWLHYEFCHRIFTSNFVIEFLQTNLLLVY